MGQPIPQVLLERSSRHVMHNTRTKVKRGSFAGKCMETETIRCLTCSGTVIHIEQREVRRK